MDEIKVSLSKEKALNTEIKDINYIPGYKQYELERQQNEIIRQSNETTRQSNETARETYVNELKQRVDSGEFKGEKGDKGEDGKQGPAGPQGEQGETGPTGPQGEQGPKGEQGETGSQGPQGETGAKGEQGETGSQGPQGETGAKGEKGDKGDKGDKGEKGDNAIPPKSQNTATGTSIKLEDSSDLDIKSLVLSGNSSQETRSGKNLFTKQGNATPTTDTTFWNIITNTTPESNGWCKVSADNTSGTSSIFANQMIKRNAIDKLEVNTMYSILVEVRNLTMSGSGSTPPYLQLCETAKNSVWQSTQNYDLTIFKETNKAVFQMLTKTNFDSSTMDFRNFVSVPKGYKVEFEYRLMVVKGSYTLDTIGEYEPYGVSPSPDFPSPIESVGRVNWLDVPNTYEVTGVVFKTNLMIPKGTYTVSAENIVIGNETSALIRFRFGNDDKYVYLNASNNFTGNVVATDYIYEIDIYSSGGYNESLNKTSTFTNLMLNKGSSKVPYVPYEHTEISATVTGKNLFNASKIPSSSKIVVTDDGKTITMPVMGSGSNGVTTTNMTLSQLAPNLKVGDVVWLNATTTSAANKYIYLMGSGRLWYFGASATIQQKDLDSVVNLYGNRYTDGETEQVVITDFRITKNSTDTWEEYKSNSLAINLQGNELCSLPNGTKDGINIANGRAKIIKKVGELTAEELEIGELILSDPNYILFSTTQLDGIAVSSEEKNSYCNVFQWAESLSSSALTDNNYAIETVESVDKTLLKVSLSKSLLSDYTRNSIKAWLTSNNFVLYYELVTPYEIDLGEVEMPRTYYKVSNISNSANTDMSIEYYTEFKGEKGDKGDKGEKGDDGGVMILAEDDDATKIQKALSCLNSNQTQLVRPLFYRTDNTHSVYPCVQYSESTSGNTFSFMLLMEDELWAMLMTIKNDAITENFITVSLSSMIFPTITGYDATKTQVLKNVNGTLTWVDES